MIIPKIFHGTDRLVDRALNDFLSVTFIRIIEMERADKIFALL